MPHRFKALLFDLDGTIIDSVDDLCATANTLLTRLGRRPLTRDEMKVCTGDGLKAMLDKALRLTGPACAENDVVALMPEFLALYAEILPSPSCIFPGMMDFLAQEKTRGTRLAVVTNKHEAATHRLLKQLDLAEYFSVVIGGDTLAERKPHPLPLLHALRKLDVNRDDAAMIGDSQNDALAANSAGIPCVILRYGYGGEWPQDVKPDAFANDVAQCTIALQLL